jgi:hypothetical protein
MKTPALIATFVLALVGLAAPASADGTDPVFTWPDVVAFNPDTTSYVFHVEYSGTETLRAWWDGHVQEIPGSGDVEMTFPTQGEGNIGVVLCRADGTCGTYSSPLLSVFRSHVIRNLHPVPAGPAQENRADFSMWPVDVGTDVTWHLSDPAGEEVATGTDFVVPDALGSAIVEYDVPADGPSGNYRLVLDAASDSPAYGHLEGHSAVRSVAVDTQPPTGSLIISAPTLFPERDGYLDSIDLVGRLRGAQTSKLQIVSPTGSVVAQWPGNERLGWKGNDEHGGRIPAGSYAVRLVGVDLVGNQASVSRPLVISDKQLVDRTWTRTFSATDTIASTWIGSCSTLRRPASHGWAESFGLYSQTTCRRPAQSAVVVYSGVWLPRSTGGAYGNLSISMYGGAARGRSSAYVVLGLRRADDDSFQNRAQFAGGLGWHRMRSTNATPFVRDDGRPFVIWQTGLSEGSRYDVRSYRLSLTYFVLR